MRKIILHNSQSPGDLVMLTAAVRDLHRYYPGRFRTDVRTPYPELWEHNPFIKRLKDSDPDVQSVQCHYPLVHRSNQSPYHFLHGFTEFLNERLQVRIRPTDFKGDIYLADAEKQNPVFGPDKPGLRNVLPPPLGLNGQSELVYWLMVAGGKPDFTIKWWSTERWQQVVDHFQGRIQFVQVGAANHHHPPLRGVLDLRGQTTLRELIRLVYHAQGVVCPVTLAMHLAAAVPVKTGGRKTDDGGRQKSEISNAALQIKNQNSKIENRNGLRPCVVVAGGREPWHWEAYPGHQFIHTIGQLPCCRFGGCWKSRTLPLGDGDPNDASLCENVVASLPRCMDLITPSEVIRRIESYFHGGVCRYLDGPSAPVSLFTAVHSSAQPSAAAPQDAPLTTETARLRMDEFIESIPLYPGSYRGRGVVICGGGVDYLPSAWVCINMLRHLGCNLPIQLWHLGPEEMDGPMRELAQALGVETVDACEVRKAHPVRRLGGWELKPFAILHCPFEEVLLLDADNVPVANPEFLFDAASYRETGAIFWPDRGRLGANHRVWRICGIEERSEPDFESGQLVVNKKRCWRELQLTLWLNEHSHFFYRHVHGDKETFHLAWRKLGRPYAMPPHAMRPMPGVFCQHDFQGRRLFQHCTGQKWTIIGDAGRPPGFYYETECRQFLRALRDQWDYTPHLLATHPPQRTSVGTAKTAPARSSGTGRKVITLVLYKRPDYTRAVLEALRRCEGVEDYLLLPHVEPGDAEVLALAQGIDFAETKVALNRRRVGCGWNTFLAWQDGFNHGDFIVHIEDDTVPAPDCLRYLEHCRRAYAQDREVFSAATYNRDPCSPEDRYRLGRRSAYTCWLVGLWKDRWGWVRDHWSLDAGRYATHLAAQVLKRGLKEVYPLLSRSQNIGAERGLHVTSPEWHRQHHHTEHWAGNFNLPAGPYHETELLHHLHGAAASPAPDPAD